MSQGNSVVSKYISYEDYISMSFNGVSLNDINQTKGDLAALNALFNTNFELKQLDFPEVYRYFSNGDIRIKFYQENTNRDYIISNIEVISSDVTLEIQGVDYVIGEAKPSFLLMEKVTSLTFEVENGSNQYFLDYVNYIAIRFALSPSTSQPIVTAISFTVFDN
ncbi:MAG: hypothetical protein ACPGR7_05245 [Flavobacteriaceae bacterium]